MNTVKIRIKAAPSTRHSTTPTVGSRRPSRLTALKRRVPRWARPWLTVGASIIGGIALWQLLVSTLATNALVIVSPSQVWHGIVNSALHGPLWGDIGLSMQEFAIGFGLGAASGIVLGSAVGLSRALDKILTPWILICYTIPIIAIAPLIIVTFGIGVISKAIIIAIVTFFPVAINTTAGIKKVPRELHEVFVVFDATWKERVFHLVLRSALPYVIVGLRLASGIGLIGVVVADLFGSNKGLGFLILSSQQNLDIVGIYVGLVVLAIIGLALNGLFLGLQRLVEK